MMLILLTLIFTLQFNICAEETGKPLIYIEAEAPDENGVFDLVVSIENFHFVGYQIAVKYDSAAVSPVSDSGDVATKFMEFATEKEHNGIASVGEKLNAESGYFTFTQYCAPGISSDYTKERMMYFVEKTEMYRFRFKNISDGNYGFDIASAFDGDVYDSNFPDGVLVTSFVEERPVIDVVIRYEDTIKSSSSSYYAYAEMYPTNFTKEQRLAGTVYVVNGDYAAAVNGVLFAIDSANKSVVPYEKDGVQYYPLRFVCESLGYTIGWNEFTECVTVTAPDGFVKEIDTNTEERCEIVHDRTMVTGELLTEVVKARIYTYDDGESIVYTGIPEWTPEREAEKDALDAMRYVLLPFFRMFI